MYVCVLSARVPVHMSACMRICLCVRACVCVKCMRLRRCGVHFAYPTQLFHLRDSANEQSRDLKMGDGNS